MARPLLTIARKWGLAPMEWAPSSLSKDGSHYHFPHEKRTDIYGQIKQAIEHAWSGAEATPIVALCKETKQVRSAVGIDHSHCNCE